MTTTIASDHVIVIAYITTNIGLVKTSCSKKPNSNSARLIVDIKEVDEEH